MAYYFKTEKMAVGYEKCPLIENIEICLEKGEILTLIGPNGAGKSTILKSISRQLELIAGVVRLGDFNLSEMSGSDLSKEMSVVLTEKLQTEMMTCEDVVATGRYPYTGRFGLLSEDDYRIVDETMKLVHVDAIRDQDFTKISDGQRQRVMLARAICQEPEIIVLDEPTSYLDVKYKLEFLSILQEMKRKKGLTVIMSLHELELAERVSDKILCVDGTRADRFGTPEEVFEPGYISKLFSISTGSFDEKSGTMELQAPEGPAKVFVIAGGGCGKHVYRRLQREGIAFSAGILFENDVDYPAANALACSVVAASAFEPITDSMVEEAKHAIDQAEQVICCKEKFGSFEKANEELMNYAKAAGKLVMEPAAAVF